MRSWLPSPDSLEEPQRSAMRLVTYLSHIIVMLHAIVGTQTGVVTLYECV